MTIRTDLTINWEVSPRIITVASPSTEATVQDIYDTCMSLEAESNAMEDPHIINAAGKESLGGGTSVGLTVTLLDAKLAFEARPGPSFIQCAVGGGNLVAVDTFNVPTSPIEPTSYTQVLLTSSSSATLQDLESVQAASFAGGVAIKPSALNTGTDFPAGTREFPTSVFMDAHYIAHERGLNKFFLMEDFTLGNFNLSGMNHVFIGDSPFISLTIEAQAVFTNSSVENLTLIGELDGLNKIFQCNIGAVSNISGFVKDCAFNSTVSLNGTTGFYDCYSNTPGMGYPIVDVGSNVLMTRNFSGSIGLTNVTGGIHTLHILGGRVILDNTCSGGTVYVRGDTTVDIEDNSSGTIVVDQRFGRDNLTFPQYIGLK